VASALVQHGDPYCHHGELAAFYRADQHLEERGSTFPAYRSKDGIDAPYYNKVARRLSKVAKLYLVPSLDQEGSQEARENQAGFTKAMDTESRERLFPRYGNAKPGRVVGIGNHFMSQYQPYLHNQLLESISPQRMHERIAQRAVFKQQMDEYYGRTPEREHQRNKIFLALQERVGEALQVTQQAEGGREALQRFDAVGDPKAYYERIHS